MSAIAVQARPPAFDTMPLARTTMATALAPDVSENGHGLGPNEASSSSTSAGLRTPRPVPARTNTDQILSYYQSEDAGRTYGEDGASEREEDGDGEGGAQLEAGGLPDSPASTYSDAVSLSDSPLGAGTAAQARTESAAQSQAQAVGLTRRRTSTRSSGGSDNRRVAVIEMDADSDGDPECCSPLRARQLSASSSASSYSFSDDSFVSATTATTCSPAVSAAPSTSADASTNNNAGLLTRRGIDGLRFAFIAPPDASPSAYTNLTPPLSAPPQTQHIRKTTVSASEKRAVNASAASASVAVTTATRSAANHQRSQSEAVVTSAPAAVAPSKGHPNRLRKGSRDIGIVGTMISPTTGQMRIDSTEGTHNTSVLPAQGSPIFQRPKLSETPSVSYISDTASSSSNMSTVGAGSGPSKPSQSPSKTSSSSASSHPSLMSNNVISPPLHQHATAPGGPRSSPAVVGHAPHHYWQTPATASTAYAHYAIMSQANGTVLSTAQFMPVSSMSSSQHPSSSSSSPTMVSQSTSTPSTSASNANMLHYQAGRDATAGPLPSPPRQVIPPSSSSPPSSPKSTPGTIPILNSAPPPRPPRLHAPGSNSPDRSSREKPANADRSLTNKSSSASISMRSPGRANGADQFATISAGDHITPSSSTMSTLVDSQAEDPQPLKPRAQHAREGAFPPNSIFVTQATPPRASQQQQQQPLKHKNTMDELVQDVSNAIEEAEARKGGVEGKRRKGSVQDLRREQSHSTFRSDQPHGEAQPQIDPDRESVQSPTSDYSDDEMDTVLVARTGGATKPPASEPFTHPPPTSFPTPTNADAAELRNAKRSLSPQRQLLEFAAKRFSALPRTPSRLSASRSSQRSSISADRDRDQHAVQPDRILITTPSPTRAKKVYLPKTRSLWPDAMEFKHDILRERLATERSRGYAEKINELANHDSGLGEWVVMMRIHLTQSNKQAHRRSTSPSYPKGLNLTTPKTRHVSRGSIGSEVTFPKRIDAYVATDLAVRPSESAGVVLEGPPPSLPYPSLAQGLTASAVAKLGSAKSSGGGTSVVSIITPSLRSLPLSASSSGSKGSGGGGGGFFASIGRKASMKREPTLRSVGLNGSSCSPSSSSGAKLLSKRHQQQQQTTPSPRPVQLTAQPALPGGPRAPPNRIQRAQSVIAGKTPAASLAPSVYGESESELGHGMMSIRRSPSVAPSTATSARGPPPPLPPRDFDKQLAKLADLMPNADKTILAGYLRRAGSDIVAIGQFLEDQKNGCLRRE